MGIHYRYAAALLALLSFQALATERVRVDPYIKAGPGYTATTGSLTGYVPTKSNDQLLLEATRKGWLGPDGAKTPIDVKPKVKVPVGGIAGKLKSVLKLNPTSLAMSAATSAALAAIDAVMDPTNNSVTVRQPMVGEIPVGEEASGWDPIGICGRLPASQTMGKITVVTYNAVTWAVWVGRPENLPSGYTQKGNNCTNTGLGYVHVNGVWPISRARAISIGDITETVRPAGDSDFDKLDPWANAQTGPFLRDLLRDVCEASSSPQACFDDLQKQSPPSISGPSSAVGPTKTTSGTYQRPDGSMGTTSTTTNTEYNITYGDNYYDYNTTNTTTTTKDGVTTGTETTSDAGPITEQPPEEENPPQEEEQYTFEDSALPEIEPFYEQKYPDGFQGVWNEARTSFENSSFISFLHGFVPSFGASCPSWSMSFNIWANANFGSIGFVSLCYIFAFVKVIILVTAAFTCRAIMFGG